MTGKQATTPKSQIKRPSRGYRKFLRRQKQAAGKTIGATADKLIGKRK